MVSLCDQSFNPSLQFSREKGRHVFQNTNAIENLLSAAPEYSDKYLLLDNIVTDGAWE